MTRVMNQRKTMAKVINKTSRITRVMNQRKTMAKVINKTSRMTKVMKSFFGLSPLSFYWSC
jgi:hypothetical protein